MLRAEAKPANEGCAQRSRQLAVVDKPMISVTKGTLSWSPCRSTLIRDLLAESETMAKRHAVNFSVIHPRGGSTVACSDQCMPSLPFPTFGACFGIFGIFGPASWQ